MTRPAPKSAPAAQPPRYAQTRFIKIIEATTDIVTMMDRAGQVLYMNIAARRLFGWPEREDTEQHSLDEMHPSWAYELIVHESIPSALEIGCWSGETALLSSDGREIPVLQLVLAHTNSTGEVEFLSTICRDISHRKQEELQRIEWANRYDAAIRASGQVLFDWDSASNDITYGGDVQSLFGYSPDSMAGGLNRLRELIDPEDLPAFDAKIESVLLTRDPFQHEFRAQRYGGRKITVNAQGFFFLDRLGRIGRMVGFLKDVTTERTAEEAIQIANEQLEQRVTDRTIALECAAEALKNNAHQQEAVARLGQIALAGLALPRLMQNAVETVRNILHTDMSSVLEFQPNECVFTLLAQSGWPTEEVPDSISGGALSQSGYTLLRNEPVVSADFDKEDRFQISESVRDAECKSGISVNIRAGERPLGVLCAFSRTVRDYTREEVNFLQSVANVLSSAIERNRVEEDARKAQQAAETANRAKSEFLSRMSHELRTPLNAILGFTQLLEMENHTPAQAESIEHISRAGKNLLELINEVLDIARIEAGRMQFQIEAVELVAVLREVSAISAPLALRQSVSIHIAPDMPDAAYAAADPARIKQVFLNLLSNAVKYNRTDGTVTIAVASSGEGYCRVSITDTGNGIAEEQLSRLFLPFERLGATGSGSGLGLTLCKRLVSAMEGRIGVTSEVGLGSTFWVELPISDHVDIQDSAVVLTNDTNIHNESSKGRKKKLLYIEDDLPNFYLLERIIHSRADIELLSAIQASIGIELAREHHPDAILLDLNLPDMAGEEVLKLLKSDSSTATIPVIVVTGEAASDHSALVREHGAAGILGKPYRVQELLALLDRIFT